jgi:hypothetical protein
VELKSVFKTELANLAVEELNSQNCSYRATQLPPCENKKSSDNLAQTGSELAQVTIATCPVDRRNQIVFTSQ